MEGEEVCGGEGLVLDGLEEVMKGRLGKRGENVKKICHEKSLGSCKKATAYGSRECTKS